MESVLRGDAARELSEHILRTYFRTQAYPYTRHHIESYDQFLSQDLPAIVAARNPIQLLQSQIGSTGIYAYRAEIFIGGMNGQQLYIGTPSVSLKDSEEIRLLYPNEARLRNLTYSATVEANIVIRITYAKPVAGAQPLMTEVVMDPVADPTNYGYLARFPLFKIPIMLHSRYCILHGKPQTFLKEAGECVYDYGGYFIVEGSEKVLVTHQEQAFNTLYVTPQERDPKLSIYATISCLNATTRQVKRVAFGLQRREGTLQVSLPFVRKPVPIFLLFRAMGIQADEDIIRLILPNPDAAETKMLEPFLEDSIVDSFPFLDTFSAVQYIKVLTKGFSEAHVLDILHNQTFIHVEDRPGARIAFLAECVRKILRVAAGLDSKTDRDDTRNQRCLTSGVLTRMMFQGVYANWAKAAILTLDKEYKFNVGIYQDSNFQNLFLQGTLNQMLKAGQITEGIQRAFKGKWSSGSGAGVGEEKTGVIQPLSRLSYIDFLSHCRRVVLDFDTGMKLPGPRRLHTSQYGYFCTSETPGGASIGITKNLSILASVSTATDPAPFVQWLLTRGGVTSCDQMTSKTITISVPVFVNNGIVGYTLRPIALRDTLKAMKWTGCLPASVSVGFNIRDRRVFVFLDEGRPLRPLIHLGPKGTVPLQALERAKTWRDLVLGVFAQTITRTVHQSGFIDPLASDGSATLESYMTLLGPNTGVIEYMDPYEMNEAYIANFPEYIQPETSHMEIHPSTIVGVINGMIPYAHHNQSPRNQLGCSQAKQGIALYATNFRNRFDNQAHVLCYAQAPIVRTLYYDYMADGQMGYGQNMILAIGSFTGYNQDDGIVMNADSFARGMFRSTCYRSYEVFEEDDMQAHTKTRIGNPARIPGWTSLKPGVDYSMLDDRGIIRPGSLVDETTVLVGAYLQSQGGEMRDASKTAQVWTRGRVDTVVVTTNNAGLAMVKVRIVQERVPELGDKFCLTPDHEVLTKERGWLPIADVTTTMSVAQLNRDTDALEYVKPKEVFTFDHDGDMYHVKTQGVNLCTTLNHRMWVQQRNSEKHELIKTSDMMGKRVRFSSYSPTSSQEYSLKVGGSVLSGNTMDAFIQLFGIWMAEGWVYSKPEQHIQRLEICANKARVKEILESACEALGVKTNYVESTEKFYVNSSTYVDFFRDLSVGAIRKYLPAWCFELSQVQSKLLMESMCLGDGHETATSLSYSTSSKQLRDDLQIVVQHAGFTSSYYKAVEKDSVRVDSSGRKYVANADNWHVQIRRKRLYPTLNHGHSKSQGGQKEEIIQYSGKVHCISVPSEVFLVRNSGTIVWTGNSNRHGQKGTIGMFVRSYDMPRTREGIPVDMIMNPHAIPSRMTIAQLVETLVGKAAAPLGTIGNGTLFMNDGNPVEAIGAVLRDSLGMEPNGEELMYDGMSGQFIPTQVFVGNVYGMRLKHLVEDKWNARGAGRREQRTHQPTGGRGNQGGLRIGEMERDAIVAHGVSGFLRESMMKRADGYETYYCNGCGTIPIYNEKDGMFICSMCDGPVQFVGETAANLDILPPVKRSLTTFSKVEIPYALKLLDQELATYLNMSMRVLTDKDMTRLRGPALEVLGADTQREILAAPLPDRILLDTTVPELIPQEEPAEASLEDLAALGAATSAAANEEASEAEEASAGETARNTIINSVAAPVASNGAPTIYLNTLGSGPVQQQQQQSLQEDDMDGVSFVNEQLQQPQQQQQQQQQQQPGSVSVQTSTQPFLVVPVNVGSGPAPTEFIPPAVPGAPATIAVDTSGPAMRSINLQQQSQGQVQSGGRSRSGSRSSQGSQGSHGSHRSQGSQGTVTVKKMGGVPDGATSPGASVKVVKFG